MSQTREDEIVAIGLLPIGPERLGGVALGDQRRHQELGLISLGGSRGRRDREGDGKPVPILHHDVQLVREFGADALGCELGFGVGCRDVRGVRALLSTVRAQVDALATFLKVPVTYRE